MELKKHLKIGALSLVTSAFLVGCGSSGGVSDTTPTASLQDSAVQGLSYETQSKSGTTDASGNFEYELTDTNVTFKAGELTIATYDINSVPSDQIVYISDLVGVDRNNTTDEKIVKVLRVLQSLDDDNNASNGILITDNVKNSLSTTTNLLDNNISTLETLVTTATSRAFVSERNARKHYIDTLTAGENVSPDILPFVTIWETNSTSQSITIPTNTSNSSYNYNVDWGDGESNSSVTGDITHTYATDGNHTVKITGTFPRIDFSANTVSKDYLKLITAWGDIRWESFFKAFNGCSNLDSNATDTPDLSGDIIMAYAFKSTSFNVDISTWDTARVTNMSGVFQYNTSFNQDIGDWNTSSVTNISNMFDGATSFNQDIGDWNTSSLLYARYVFQNASAFTDQNLSRWDVSNVDSSQHANFMTGAGTGNTEPNWQ